MLVDIVNKNESTLVIEYNSKVFKFAGNQTGSLDVEATDFCLSAYTDIIETIDLELEGKSLKNRLFQKGFDKMLAFGKKLMVQCKNTYHISLNSSRAELVFELDAFGKDNSFAQDFFDMPIDLTSFTRLECDLADIEVVSSVAINKKEFLKVYRRMYFWVNFSLDMFTLLLYLPSYIKQKKMVSQKQLTKTFKKFYSVSREERDKLVSLDTDDDFDMDENEPVITKKGCLKTFLGIGIFIALLWILLAVIIVFLIKSSIIQ